VTESETMGCITMRKAEKTERQQDPIAERLKEALERKGWSKWRFQQEMAAWGAPGSSRANIDRYLKGEVRKLPVKFLVVAARLLQVNLLWLLGESPAMTREDVAAWEASVKEDSKEFRERVERELQKAFPLYRRLDKTARGPVWTAWEERYIRLTREQSVKDEQLPPDAVEDAANDVGRALMAPLEAYDVDHRELFIWDLGHYTTAVCQALAFLKQRGPHPALPKRGK